MISSSDNLNDSSLHLHHAAGNTIYSTTEDEDESGALKATPRAGRHGAHPPRPHRKFHRHRTPSSASEGDLSQQQQTQPHLSGRWSGSRGEVTGRSLDEDEADNSAGKWLRRLLHRNVLIVQAIASIDG